VSPPFLIEDGKIARFSRTETTYAAMGRFGNAPARRRRDRPFPERQAQRGRTFLPHQHREHARVQRRTAWGAREARGRRQRPLRARAVRRLGHPRSLGASRGRRPVRVARGADARAPHPHPRADLRPGDDRRQRRARRRRRWPTSSTSCPRTRSGSRNASGLPPYFSVRARHLLLEVPQQRQWATMIGGARPARKRAPGASGQCPQPRNARQRPVRYLTPTRSLVKKIR
jgi:hypothetical protein